MQQLNVKADRGVEALDERMKSLLEPITPGSI